MRMIYAACLLAFLAGCKEEISREQVGEPTVKTGERSCSVPGYCFRFAMNSKGEMGYGYGYSSFCAGKQTATVKTTIFQIRYDDGSTKMLPHSETVSASRCEQ